MNLAYPLGDIVLMGSILGVLALSGFRPGSGWLPLGAGFMVFGLSDAIYSVQATVGTYRVRGVLDVGWPAAHLLIAYAAWMPSRPARRVRSDDWRTASLPVIVWCVGRCTAGVRDRKPRAGQDPERAAALPRRLARTPGARAPVG